MSACVLRSQGWPGPLPGVLVVCPSADRVVLVGPSTTPGYWHVVIVRADRDEGHATIRPLRADGFTPTALRVFGVDLDQPCELAACEPVASSSDLIDRWLAAEAA